MDAIQSGKRRRISLKSDMDNLTATFEPDELVQKNIRETENSRDGNQTWAHTALASVPFVLVLGNSMIVPILPTLERQLGISNFQTSLVVTLFSVTAALVIPLAGYLSDRFSRKHVIVPALLIYGGAGILSGLAAFWQSYSWLIVFRAIQGIGAAGTTPIALALVGDMYKGAQESKALDLIEASNGFGKVVSPIFGSLLALLVWFAPFFALPVCCLISLLAILFLVKEPKPDREPKPLSQYAESVKRIFAKDGKWLFATFFSGSLSMFILFGVLFFLSNILEQPPYGINGVWKGFILAIPLFGMVVTAYLTGAIIRKNGVLIRLLMNIGLALMVASLALAIWWNKNLYLFVGLLTASSIGTGMILPCFTTMITGAVEKEERGMITSLYSSLRFLGVAIGPPIFGWLMGISRQTVFVVVSALALLALGLVFFWVKPDKQVH